MYEAKRVTLSKNQAYKLSRGKKVRLTYNALRDGPNTIYITAQQSRKIQTRLNKGVGMDIGPFDQAQIAHNAQHGGSIWGDIKKAGRYVFNNAVRPGANLLYQEVGRPLLNEAKKEGAKYAVDTAKDYAKNFFKKGEGVGRRGQRGGNFFGDIGKVFKGAYKHVIKPVGQVVLPVAKDVVKEVGPVLIKEGVPILVKAGMAGAGAKRGRGGYRTIPSMDMRRRLDKELLGSGGRYSQRAGSFVLP